MGAVARRSVELMVALLAVASLVFTAAPASAQVAPPGGGGVSCDPANPEPGGQTECTAEGLEADSDYQWTAEFSGGTTEEGDGTADADGVGTFTVDVPDEEGEYTVTVTGTNEDGEAYEESFSGEVGGGEGLPLPLPSDSESPSEEPSEGGTESEGEDDGTGSDDGTSGGDDQVSPVPSGGVATGMGGMADDGPSALTLLAVLLVLGAAGAVAVRRRADH